MATLALYALKTILNIPHAHCAGCYNDMRATCSVNHSHRAVVLPTLAVPSQMHYKECHTNKLQQWLQLYLTLTWHGLCTCTAVWMQQVVSAQIYICLSRTSRCSNDIKCRHEATCCCEGRGHTEQAPARRMQSNCKPQPEARVPRLGHSGRKTNCCQQANRPTCVWHPHLLLLRMQHMPLMLTVVT